MGGMQIKYAELLSLSIEELFYQNKICRTYQTEPLLDIRIVPTEECVGVMNRLDIIFRNTDTNGGCIVLARVLGKNGAGNDLMRFPAKNEDKLTFLLVLKNPELLNFSDLSTKPVSNKIYYLSNNIDDAAATRKNLHLSTDAPGVNENKDFVKKTNAIYRFHHIAPVGVGTVKIKHLLTGSFVLPTSISNNAGQSDLVFDLTPIPSGKCQLLINNAPVDEFYFSSTNSTQNVIAVVELMLASTIKPNYRIIEPDRSLLPERPLFKATFINRKTIWRYAIHLQADSPLYKEITNLNQADKQTYLDHLNIETNDSNIKFDKVSTTETDFLFQSQNVILLQEKYFSSTDAGQVLKLTLRKDVGLLPPGQHHDLKDFLPYPSTHNIDASNNLAIYSDIFLTL